MCRTLLFNLAEREDDGSVPEKPKRWKEHCSSILMQPVSDCNSLYYDKYVTCKV